jgi:hypothetical protein
LFCNHKVHRDFLITLYLTITICFSLQQHVVTRVVESGIGSRWKKKKCFGAPSRGGPAKNLDTESERLTFSCRVTWAWFEAVNFYSRKIMLPTRKTNTVDYDTTNECYNERMLRENATTNEWYTNDGTTNESYNERMLHERWYNVRMLQRKVFINKIEILRTQMIQRTRRNTIGRVARACALCAGFSRFDQSVSHQPAGQTRPPERFYPARDMIPHLTNEKKKN